MVVGVVSYVIVGGGGVWNSSQKHFIFSHHFSIVCFLKHIFGYIAKL